MIDVCSIHTCYLLFRQNFSSVLLKDKFCALLGVLDLAQFIYGRSMSHLSKGSCFVNVSMLGVTTIAGGYSKKPGHEDGPAQNASFSDDFEISFVPELCALLISDHGNQLVRLMSLKEEDCAGGSKIGELWKSIFVFFCYTYMTCILYAWVPVSWFCVCVFFLFYGGRGVVQSSRGGRAVQLVILCITMYYIPLSKTQLERFSPFITLET